MDLPSPEEYLEKKRKISIENERQEAIHAVMAFMGEPYKKETSKSKVRYKYWNGRLKKYSPKDMHSLIKKAQSGKNPQALFNWLLKQ